MLWHVIIEKTTSASHKPDTWKRPLKEYMDHAIADLITFYGRTVALKIPPHTMPVVYTKYGEAANKHCGNPQPFWT